MMVIADLDKGAYKAARKFAKGLGYAAAKLVRKPHILAYDIIVGTAEAVQHGIIKTGKFLHNEAMLQVALENEHTSPEWAQAVIQEYMDSDDTVYALARAAAKMSAEEWGETIGDTVIAYYSGRYIHSKTQPILKKIYNAAASSAAAKTFADFKKAFKAKLKAKLDKLWPTTAKNGINGAIAENIAQDQSIFKQIIDEYSFASGELSIEQASKFLQNIKDTYGSKNLNFIKRVLNVSDAKCLVKNPQLMSSLTELTSAFGEIATHPEKFLKCIDFSPIIKKDVLAQGLKAFAKTPGFLSNDCPFTKVLQTGKITNTAGHLTTAKGAMFEIERALELHLKGTKIEQFGYKIKVGIDEFEFDIVTKNAFIECKDIRWSNLDTVKYQGEFKDKKLISNKLGKTFEIHSKRAIPEIWQDWLKANDITFYQN